MFVVSDREHTYPYCEALNISPALQAATHHHLLPFRRRITRPECQQTAQQSQHIMSLPVLLLRAQEVMMASFSTLLVENQSSD
jgi:hypothetical protein